MVVGVAAGLLTDPSIPVVDPDCPGFVRYGVALTISGGGRRNDIALIGRDGDVTRLTSDHASRDPSFSPDGRQLAFARGSTIVVSDVDGTDVQMVTDGEHSDSEPAWSPDGDMIAFVREGAHGAGVKVVPVAGGQPQRLVGAGVMLVPVGGGEPRLLYQAPQDENMSPQWSPDGDRIAFVADPDGSSDANLYVINRDGSGLREVASHLGSVGQLAWSPDGETFAFNGSVYTLTFEEPSPQLVRETGVSSVDFSPDGTHLVFAEEDFNPDGPSSLHYMVVPLDGGSPSPLTQPVSIAFEASVDWLDCR